LVLYERAVLKLAISFLDQEKHDDVEYHNWRVRLTAEEVDALPGEYWECVDGQPCPK
jgi:hypothetical protein